MTHNCLPRRTAMTHTHTHTQCHAGQRQQPGLAHRMYRLPETTAPSAANSLIIWALPRKHSPDGATKAR